jgi:RNA polymerase II subunit A small phosphatase-like protein
LVLDLDETLVHSSFKPPPKPDIILPVEIEGNVCNVFVLIRPGTEFFLQRLSKCYELVIYTASLSKYADPLIDILDSKPQKIIDYRLFREHCTFFQGVFIKDMSLPGRPLTDSIIIDNSPTSYAFH